MTRRLADAPEDSGGLPYSFFVGVTYNQSLDDLGEDFVDLANSAVRLFNGD